MSSNPPPPGPEMDNERPYADPSHEGNATHYLTGEVCAEPGCEELAGTGWSPLWCFSCNVKRMDRIGDGLKSILASLENSPKPCGGP